MRSNRLTLKIDFFVKTSLPPVEGIFYDGQIFDAYSFVSDLIRTAKKSIVLFDNYVDDTVLTMLDKRKKKVSATIYTQEIKKAVVTRPCETQFPVPAHRDKGVWQGSRPILMY